MKMLAVKSVRQKIVAPQEFYPLFKEYRNLINEAIRVGLELGITSKYKLIKELYPKYKKNWQYHSWYILSAISKACAILRNYRKKKKKVKRPYVKKAFISIDNLGFKIEKNRVRLTVKPRQWVYIELCSYMSKVLSEPNLKLGSVTITANILSISFSKETELIEPSGYIGVDRNIDIVATASSNGECKIYSLSKISEVKSLYREVISHFKRNDVRIRNKIFRKYGKKQRLKEKARLHQVSKDIVEEAKANNFAVVMENLKGIRKLYRKGNGQGKQYRGKLNSWSFYELQRQIEYKAKWIGIPVYYVNPRDTSKKCSKCGCSLKPEKNRFLKCLSCNKVVHRDLNAARNILARAPKFRADGQPIEAMVSVKR